MEEQPSWLQKHSGELTILVAILAACCGSLLWMSGKFATLERDMSTRFTAIEKDMAVIKAVLVIKQIMPNELAKAEPKQ